MKINLLPWRQQQRQQELKLFLFWLLGIIVLLIALWIILHIVLAKKIADYKNNNQGLEQQISALRQQFEELEVKQKHIQRQQTINATTENIASEQIWWLNFLLDLKHNLPSGIYLTQIQKNQKVIELIGKAQSHAEVTVLLQNLAKSKMEVKLIKLNHEKANAVLFHCQITLVTI